MTVHAGAHVVMRCPNHPDLRWSCKVVAVTRDGRYNGARNIFYHSREPECPCPGSDLMIDTESLPILQAFHG